MSDVIEFIEPVLMVGDRKWPARKTERWGDHELGALGGVHRNRHVYIIFENAWAVSVVWGDSTYSSNYDVMDFLNNTEREFTEEPRMVECAVLPEDGAMDGTLIDLPHGDSVLGYATADEVNALCAAVMKWPRGQVGAWPEDFRHG